MMVSLMSVFNLASDPRKKLKKNTDLWEANCHTGPGLTPQRFDPPSPGGAS